MHGAKNLSSALEEKDQQHQRDISWAKNLNYALEEKDQQLHRNQELKRQLDEEHQRIVSWANNLNVAIVDRDNQLMQFRISWSWRVTAPFRWIFSRICVLKKIIRAMPRAIVYYGSLPTALRKTLIILRRDGITGIKLKAQLLSQESNE